MKKPPEGTRRWRAVCAYNGTGIGGWQSQKDGNSVQDFIERRLAVVLGVPARIHGSGRTDAGVHARAQVFHFDAEWTHGAATLERALRTGMPAGIQVTSVRAASADFHARFSAKGKTYIYHLEQGRADVFRDPFCWSLVRPLDVAAMQRAASVLRGRHDFKAFSAFGGEERESTVRDLTRLDVVGRGSRLRVVAEADGFLYKMVRSLVGALVAVGLGKLTEDGLARILESRTRTNEVQTAPAKGLFLWRVKY
ncbi:MAG TPA: tRNA pseudouridine(38-40) synthase TruA [Opitutaceae bacterium]